MFSNALKLSSLKIRNKEIYGNTQKKAFKQKNKNLAHEKLLFEFDNAAMKTEIRSPWVKIACENYTELVNRQLIHNSNDKADSNSVTSSTYSIAGPSPYSSIQKSKELIYQNKPCMYFLKQKDLKSLKKYQDCLNHFSERKPVDNCFTSKDDNFLNKNSTTLTRNCLYFSDDNSRFFSTIEWKIKIRKNGSRYITKKNSKDENHIKKLRTDFIQKLKPNEIKKEVNEKNYNSRKLKTDHSKLKNKRSKRKIKLLLIEDIEEVHELLRKAKIDLLANYI